MKNVPFWKQKKTPSTTAPQKPKCVDDVEKNKTVVDSDAMEVDAVDVDVESTHDRFDSHNFEFLNNFDCDELQLEFDQEQDAEPRVHPRDVPGDFITSLQQLQIESSEKNVSVSLPTSHYTQDMM